MPPGPLPPIAGLRVGGGSQVHAWVSSRNSRGVRILIWRDAPQGEQVLVAGDDDMGRRGGSDEAVGVGVADEVDGLCWGDHDGREGQEFDEFVHGGRIQASVRDAVTYLRRAASPFLASLQRPLQRPGERHHRDDSRLGAVTEPARDVHELRGRRLSQGRGGWRPVGAGW